MAVFPMGTGDWEEGRGIPLGAHVTGRGGAGMGDGVSPLMPFHHAFIPTMPNLPWLLCLSPNFRSPLPTPFLRSGNDLARCLNWGGSIAQLQQQPLPGLLEEVAVAVPTLLDRWDVRITPEVGGRGGGGAVPTLMDRWDVRITPEVGDGRG